MFQIKAAAALTTVVTIAGCTTGGHATTVISSQPATPTASESAPAPSGNPGSGIVAKPASTAFPVEGRNIRLVRVDEQDIALQFELFNGTRETVEPYDLGMGMIERDFKLVDIPRAQRQQMDDEAPPNKPDSRKVNTSSRATLANP